MGQGGNVPRSAQLKQEYTVIYDACPHPGRPYQVDLTLAPGGVPVPARLAFLEEGIIRYTLDPTGAFAPYARPNSPAHAARIPAQPDESARYAHSRPTLEAREGALAIRVGLTEVLLEGPSGLLTVRRRGHVALREAAPAELGPTASSQRLAMGARERFFGGGTQNGRASHEGAVVRVVTTPTNSNQWGDGGVASPSPFFWSSAGYGIIRNTFAPGTYDFGSAAAAVTATHEDPCLDAYLLIADDPAAGLPRVAQSVLAAYFAVTGAPVLLPEYAFYLGHLNAYNRDAWSEEPERGAQAWTVLGSAPAGAPGRVRYELGRRRGYVVPEGHDAESLNGPDEVLRASGEKYRGRTPYAYSARAVIDEHAAHDMPLGWMLPNDGYGAGYGHNGYEMTGGVGPDGASSPERLEAIAANVENLAAFTAYANERGVEAGLWAQSQITPDPSPDITWQNLRDFAAEVSRAGITALKTDEEWVGEGYSFGLDATKQGYEILAARTGRRPFVLTLDGWAGTQRFAAVWSGDQNGDDWEYIRMHVPTYLGQGMSGNPNVASDMDGIFGGSAVVATRDFQWKALTPLMLDMDGWGSLPKLPYANGDPHTGICRMYLKLKSRLMPYAYTCAAAASGIEWGNGDAWLPPVRSLLLSGAPDVPAEAATYQFTLGDALLVAPVYRSVRADGRGNDVRDGIFFPGGADDLWFDYLTGEAHRGGQTLNGYDAPLWKLPLFVRAGAIIPCYEPHNNPLPPGEKNPAGLDRTRRVVEFYPALGRPGRTETRYTLFEDDGRTGVSRAHEEPGYGVVDEIDYGGRVLTDFRCVVEGGRAVLLAEPSRGSYEGYDPFRQTTFTVRVTSRPEGVAARCGGRELLVREVADRAGLLAAEPAPGEVAYLFEEAPAVETYAPAEERVLAEMVAAAHGAPRVTVRFARADVSRHAQELTLWGLAEENLDQV